MKREGPEMPGLSDYVYSTFHLCLVMAVYQNCYPSPGTDTTLHSSYQMLPTILIPLVPPYPT